MTFGYSGMPLWAFVFTFCSMTLSSVATGAAYGTTFTILYVTASTCSFPISLIAPAQTQYYILRLGKKGLWAKFRSNILRTPFRDAALFMPLRICFGALLCWWWCLYWRYMLEPHILGVHWRVPPVFRHKHLPWEAMEGASLSDSTHRRPL